LFRCRSESSQLPGLSDWNTTSRYLTRVSKPTARALTWEVRKAENLKASGVALAYPAAKPVAAQPKRTAPTVSATAASLLPLC
jgi:hypothetical protein